MMKKQDKITDKNPFKIPKGYFDDANRRIIEATIGANNSRIETGFFSRLRPYILAAASVAFFIFLSLTAVRLMAPHRIYQLESDLIIEDYLSPYINDLDIYSLEENAASLFLPEEVPDVSKTDIIEYLVLENIEISEIYDQL